MKIHLSTPVSFSQVGQRSNNQDTLFPPVGQASQDTTLFMACDGMGGADKGEIASLLLSNAVAGYVESLRDPILDAVHLRSALDLAYASYFDYLKQNPLVSRMGSTLALVQFHELGATVAHLGDSRVYQIREGKIIFQTKDHRQVNDMVEAGIISAVQAQTHPWRNRLSRAVLVSASDTTDSFSRPAADLVQLTDIRQGDYFFICTDGVQEQVNNDTLEMLLNETLSDTEKANSLLTLCQEQTKDNYSAHLIHVSSVSTAVIPSSMSTSSSYAI